MGATEIRAPIYCDCHGPVEGVVMGYIVNGKVVWYDKRHGERHFKILPEAPITDPAQGCLTSDENGGTDKITE